MENYIITWFYAEKKDDESFYPSVGGNTSSPEFQKVYWKCVYNFYESAILTQENINTKYMFFTNVPNIPTNIDGVDMKSYFEKNSIEVFYSDLTNKTPQDWYSAWRNQFYVFDVLDSIKGREGNFIILDSDCILRKDLTKAFDEIQEHGIITYDCGYEDDYEIHGISINGMRQLYDEFYSSGSEQLTYKGGEFIGVSHREIEKLLKEFKNIWKLNYEKYTKGEKKLNEEAHFLSLIYIKLGYIESRANKYIKRMWTSIEFDNVTKKDAPLDIWHLPAEKKYGLAAIFTWLSTERKTKEEYLKYSSKLFGIPGNVNIRKIKRLQYKIKNKQVKI